MRAERKELTDREVEVVRGESNKMPVSGCYDSFL